ncbi:MAG TPA: bifunctional anthranilate synthase component I family protein/class IV aminotransferase [Fimbriimonas sp.]|nr:bifunctional anthranilate synthase component I family protein/class IV aminotransferase [Fimbriimonas sp.]
MSVDPYAGSYFLDLEELQPGECALYSSESPNGWLAYRSPTSLVQCTSLEEVESCLDEAYRHVGQGGFAAGFLTYEAAPGLNPKIVTHEPEWPMFAWFGLYNDRPVLHRELKPVYEECPVKGAMPDLDFEAYRGKFDEVKRALAAGETYQVNLTFRLRFELASSWARFFTSRCGVNPPRYAAFIQGGDWQVASYSPELFFERRGSLVTSRPMKGTAVAPSDRAALRTEAARLADDPKTKAENTMIVDMVRNDLGSICEVGSIQTTDLLKVERHRGLLQVTSAVTGKLPSHNEGSSPASEGKVDEFANRERRTCGAALQKALFPAASITGAPKVSTCSLIRRLEISPRHIYCGAIGMIEPGYERFSVAIRTALIQGNKGEFGVGSGVVWDSEVASEYEECLAKAELLYKKGEPWTLVEAFAGRDLPNPAEHLARLKTSVQRFGIPLDWAQLLEELAEIEAEPKAKVRIAVRLDGEFQIQVGRSAIDKPVLQVVLAPRPVCSHDPNFRIKTSSRAVLEGFLDACPDDDEVLLYNERGELTEFCRGNLLVEIDGALWTPFPDSGCLEGVAVSRLIRENQASYRRLFLDDLARAVRLFFVNSVSGSVEAGLRALGT